MPDKGERIQKLYDNILHEINARNEINQAATLFSELNIVEKGVKTVTHMEWNGGKVDENQILVAADTLDSDDDDDEEVDPLKIIAQSRDTVKLVKVVKPPKSLITETDLEEIKSMQAENDKNRSQNGESSASTSTNTDTASDETDANSKNSIELDPHALYMMKKDVASDKNAKIKEKFLPFRTTKSDVHNVEKEKQRKHGQHWEITAATPPNLRNNSVQMIPLQESIEVEKLHKEKLREQMEKQAEERLAVRQKIVAENISLLPPGSASLDPNLFFQSYRQRAEHFDENHDSEDEQFSDNSDDGEEPDTHGITILINE